MTMAEETLATADGVSITKPTSLLRHLRYVLKAMRPKQWSKNGIVFMALIFSVNQSWLPEEFDTWDRLLLRAFLTALCFCAVSGAEYMVNDLKDRESDRLHPTKRRRPIVRFEQPVPADQPDVWTAEIVKPEQARQDEQVDG